MTKKKSGKSKVRGTRPSFAVVRELFDYSIVSGALYRRKSIGGQFAGERAGFEYRGYRFVSVGNRIFQESQIIWLWVTSEWPSSIVEHADVVGANNAWLNLRLATRSQNRANTRAQKNNALHTKGVIFRYGRYRASICKDGVRYYLGGFVSVEAAQVAYAEKAAELFGAFARAA
jgi:hypothetical protein